jgi:two-component system NtrC family response regulator
VRELANVVERASILCDEGPITVEHLPEKLEARRRSGPQLKTVAPQTLREIELQVIQQTLQKNGGNKPKTADELGISLKTLYNKLSQVSGSLERSA